MSNPVLAQSLELAQEGTWDGDQSRSATFSVSGVALKTLFLLAITACTFTITWRMVTDGFAQAFQAQGEGAGIARSIAIPPQVYTWGLAGGIAGFVLCLLSGFMPRWAAVIAPLYAACQGLFLASVTAGFEARFPGIALQAMIGVVGTTAALGTVYATGIFRPSQGFIAGVTAATIGVCILYIGSMLLGFFGLHISPLHDSSLLGIGISVVVVVIAAMNLIVDFHGINTAAEHGAEKIYEWNAALGLMVTLVWLYIEVLRLLSKLRSRE
jgi:uncharacterized YccA/Bax inhibitor family protein